MRVGVRLLVDVVQWTGAGSNAHAGGQTRRYMHTYQVELEKLLQQNEALQQEIVGVRLQFYTEQEEIKIEQTQIQAQRAAREMELRSKIIAGTIGKWTHQALAGTVSLWTQHTLDNRQLRCVQVCLCVHVRTREKQNAHVCTCSTCILPYMHTCHQVVFNKKQCIFW